MRTNAETCPNCGADLQGDPIPAGIAHQYASTHYSRKIGIYDRDKDRTVAWQCLDCGHVWDRA